jgi:hypothetical protein
MWLGCAVFGLISLYAGSYFLIRLVDPPSPSGVPSDYRMPWYRDIYTPLRWLISERPGFLRWPQTSGLVTARLKDWEFHRDTFAVIAFVHDGVEYQYSLEGIPSEELDRRLAPLRGKPVVLTMEYGYVEMWPFGDRIRVNLTDVKNVTASAP